MTLDNSTDKKKGGLGKIASAIISSIIVRHLFDYLNSKYGPDIKYAVESVGVTMGFCEDIVMGSMVAFFMKLTPQYLADEVMQAILFVKTTVRQWKDAWSKPLT